jgi:hypothetical protein
LLREAGSSIRVTVMVRPAAYFRASRHANRADIYKVVGSVKHKSTATSFLSVLARGSPISVARFHHTSIRSVS